MNFSARTILAPVEVIRWRESRYAEQIIAAPGESDLFEHVYQWVWNVAENPASRNRELRFWTVEIISPERTKNLTLDQVILSILPPNRREYPTGEVANTLLCISRTVLKRLREELNGKLGANSSFFPREGIEQFLRRRWIGAPVSEPARREAAA